MRTVETIDRSSITWAYTDEGFLIAKGRRIARIGIQEYRAFELGITDGEPMRVIRVYRDAVEVFSAETLASFENKPITVNHPNEFVDADNWRDLARGHVRNVRRDGDYQVADLIITDKAAINEVLNGKVEISNGYSADYDWTGGVTNTGERYEAQQKNIRGNHVALVDSARCGPACRVTDTHKPTTKGNMMADKKVTIDGIPFELPEAAAAAVEKMSAQLVEVQKIADSAAKLTPLKVGDATIQVSDAQPVLKLISDHSAEIERLKKDVITPDQRDALVASWAGLIAGAKSLVKDYNPQGKNCDQIRREVIAACAADPRKKPMIDAALAGRDMAAIDGETVKVVFNMLAASPIQATDAVADGLKAVFNDNAGGHTGDGAELVGRDALLHKFASLSAGVNQSI